MCSICGSTPCRPGCPNAYDPPVVHDCAWCDNDIFAGDTYYEIGGEPVCEDCVAKCKKFAEPKGLDPYYDD